MSRDGLLLEAMRLFPITALWSRRGWTGVPGKNCRMPNDTDSKKAHCSIFTATTGRHAGCQLLKNHRTGITYDGPGLLSVTESISVKEACRIFLALSGVKPLDDATPKKESKKQGHRKSAASIPPSLPAVSDPPRTKPFDSRVLSPRDLDSEEIEAIATARHVSVRAVEAVARWGCLHAVTLPQGLKLPIPREKLPMDAWALHTPGFTSFRVRSFVGCFPGYGFEPYKSLTIGGASCSVPVWVGPEGAENVLVVEGEGDCIAAFEIARRERSTLEGLAVVCIFSSSLAIPSSFLPRLQGRRVRIVPHVGDSRRQGEVAAVKWAATLKPWAAAVEIFSLVGLVMPDGSSVGDLGDLARCPDETLSGLGVTVW